MKNWKIRKNEKWVKNTDLQSLWINKWVEKSLKCKQQIYEKGFKKRNRRKVLEWKSCRTLFKTVKKYFKRNYISKTKTKTQDNFMRLGMLVGSL